MYEATLGNTLIIKKSGEDLREYQEIGRQKFHGFKEPRGLQ